MATEAQVRAVLEDPFAGNRRWTLQGFGMLRTYLDVDEVERLHLWDITQAVPDVSSVHDHPWDFDSLVVSGELRNLRFYHSPEPSDCAGNLYWQSDIKTGEGGGIFGPASPVVIGLKQVERITTGQNYHQDAPEIHESYPVPGTVTVIKRKFSKPRDFATVFWRQGTEWVTAEPRPATVEEVVHFITLAHARWTGSTPWRLINA